MKNSKLRRALMLVACAVLLVCLSVGATLAYLTSTTEVVENTFTVGKVVIDIDEALVNEYGDPVKKVVSTDDEGNETVTYEKVTLDEADRVMNNDYKLLPGHKYTKDPIVYVLAESEPCLVYVVIDNPLADIIDYQTITEQMNANWHIIGTNDTKTLYGYKTVVDAREATEAIELATFKYIKIKDELEYKDLEAYEGKQITVKAFAIQSDGMIAGTAPEWLELKNIWNNNFADPHMTLVENTTTE